MAAAAADTLPSITNTLMRPWRPSSAPRQQADATVGAETARTGSVVEATEKVGILPVNHLMACSVNFDGVSFLVGANSVARFPPTGTNARTKGHNTWRDGTNRRSRFHLWIGPRWFARSESSPSETFLPTC